MYEQGQMVLAAVAIWAVIGITAVFSLVFWGMKQNQQVIDAVADPKRPGGNVLDGVTNLLNAQADKISQQAQSEATTDLLVKAAKGMGVSVEQIQQWIAEGRITISAPKE